MGVRPQTRESIGYLVCVEPAAERARIAAIADGSQAPRCSCGVPGAPERLDRRQAWLRHPSSTRAASAGRHRLANRPEFAVRNRQGLIVADDTESFSAKLGHASPTSVQSVAMRPDRTLRGTRPRAVAHRRGRPRCSRDRGAPTPGSTRRMRCRTRSRATERQTRGYVGAGTPLPAPSRSTARLRCHPHLRTSHSPRDRVAAVDEIGVHRRVAEALGLKASNAMAVGTGQRLVQHDNVVEHAHGPSFGSVRPACGFK